MIDIFGNGVRPVCVPVTLEGNSSHDLSYVRGPRDTAHVYTFDATAQAKSLLNDFSILSNMNNLAVNVDDPFGRYQSPDGRLGEGNSGLWYDRAFDHLIKTNVGKEPEFLIGVILYCDKTGTSVQQRHGLEPLMMKFSLFVQSVRNQTFRAWRPIGYIPDLDQASAAEKQTSSHPGQQGRKYRNYHACLKACLASLVHQDRESCDPDKIRSQKRILIMGPVM